MPNKEKLNFGIWIELWEKSGAQGDPQPLYWELNDAYTAKDRYYHNGRHINAGWYELKLVIPKPRRPLQLGFAIAGHDFIQNRDGKDADEIESANFMYQRLGEANLPRYFRRDVSKLILVTDHQTLPRNYDEKVSADLDLVVFGKSGEEFDLYCAGTRMEYKHVPDEVYNSTRVWLLGKFLGRERIYYTDYFKRYEAQARINLQREIDRLSNT
ncbi:hypothetical protein HYW46_01755 [Candidatus Daviesbacteria bacterium]|nr:hypothetical protein [Candidatus Daviesbacteria bacterium]